MKRGLLRMLGARAEPSADLERVDRRCSYGRAGRAAIVAMMMLTLNLWLAAKIAATSGRLNRPWPDIRSTALPPMTLVALCVAIAFCFTGGLLAMLAQVVTSALLMAYALTGFAVLHTLTLALQQPRDLARLHLRHHGGVRLAGAGHGRARPCRRRVRISRALHAHAAAAVARGLRFHPSTPTRLNIQRRTKWKSFCWNAWPSSARWAKSSRVRDGFARNFLLKRGKALRATAENRAKYRRHEGRARGQQHPGQVRSDQGRREDRRQGNRRSSARPPKSGQLFGSVSVRDIVDALDRRRRHGLPHAGLAGFPRSR